MKFITESYQEFASEGKSFFDMKKFKSMDDVFNHEPSFKGKVANSVMNICMQERGISEKNFKGMDILKIEIEEVYSQVPAVMIAIVTAGEEEGKRVDNVAEEIYHKYYRKVDEKVKEKDIQKLLGKETFVMQVGPDVNVKFDDAKDAKSIQKKIEDAGYETSMADSTTMIISESALNEGKKDTPKAFVKICDKLMIKAEKQLGELKATLDELATKANGGVWYFSGQMQNEYNIRKNENAKELFDDLKEGLKGNTIFSLRDTRKYLGWDRAKMDKIKSANLKPDKIK